jgi:hypothetical protein
MAKSPLHDLARLGAQSRLDALDRERQAILDLFPDLGRGAGSRPVASAVKAAGAGIAARRSHMSDEARKAQSERMTTYWAARRAAKAAAAGGGSASSGGNGTPTSGAKSRGRKGRRKR